MGECERSRGLLTLWTAEISDNSIGEHLEPFAVDAALSLRYRDLEVTIAVSACVVNICNNNITVTSCASGAGQYHCVLLWENVKYN